MRGDCHTNSIEGYWSQVKQSIRGTHIHVSGKHLPKYLAEVDFRHNTRSMPAQNVSDSGEPASSGTARLSIAVKASLLP